MFKNREPKPVSNMVWLEAALDTLPYDGADCYQILEDRCQNQLALVRAVWADEPYRRDLVPVWNALELTIDWAQGMAQLP